MDSVVDISAARALVGDAAVWPRVRSFLWDFATQVDGSWLDGNPQVADLMSNPRVRRHVLEVLGVEPTFHLFPKEDWSRLVLLDGGTLVSIAKWLGAILCSEALRSVTKGADVRALKAALSGVYPDVFGFTAYFPGVGGADVPRGDAEAQDQGAELGARVVSKGVETLFGLLSGLPGPLLERLKFKLPKDICDFAAVMGGAGKDARKADADGRVVKKLLKLKFPEAYRLCC